MFSLCHKPCTVMHSYDNVRVSFSAACCFIEQLKVMLYRLIVCTTTMMPVYELQNHQCEDLIFCIVTFNACHCCCLDGFRQGDEQHTAHTAFLF